MKFMMFLSALRLYFRLLKYDLKIASDADFDKRRIEGEILRYIHSIEKGLSIASPRTGFGVKKINILIDLLWKYEKLNGDSEIIYLGLGAIKQYLNFHNNIGYVNKEINAIADKYQELQSHFHAQDITAGVLSYAKKENNLDIGSIETLFQTRHSIRQFTRDNVPEDKIINAVKLAQCAPSACNRQAVKVYNISSSLYMSYMGDLSGIGGFAEDVNRFLIITGIKSYYRLGEVNQYIVSASIFAAYLTLSLHAYGIGACVVQRPLVPDKQVNDFKQHIGISEDEQIVLMIGIGMVADKISVPVSHRLSIDKVYKKID